MLPLTFLPFRAMVLSTERGDHMDDKTRQDIESVGGYSTQGEKNDPNSMMAFLNKIDSSKVTSIKYAGETFTAQ